MFVSRSLVPVPGASSGASKRRFNLLMLEEREYYFEDFGGHLHILPDALSAPSSSSSSIRSVPFESRHRVKGRLHVASRSLVFDPEDLRIPIHRVAFRDILAIRTRKSSDQSDYFLLHVSQLILQTPASPYLFKKFGPDSPEAEVAISLSYKSLAEFMPFLQELFSLTRLPPSEEAPALRHLIGRREQAVQFDSSWIADHREKPQLPAPLICSLVQPLVSIPGLLLLTDQRLYFQAFNTLSAEPLTKVDIAEMKRVYKRRHIMRDAAMEIFVPRRQAASSSRSTSSYAASYGASSAQRPATAAASLDGQSSIYLSFGKPADRDLVYDTLTRQAQYSPHTEYSLAHLNREWVEGRLSNYDYLICLNEQAGRSFQDLTQYPVFPWVIQDFTSPVLDLASPLTFRDLSKPIGALEPRRLQSFLNRFQDMPEPRFLFGTHYSTPGYVLFYLVRQCPQYQLRLQNGRFDHADRLFNSVAGAWESCLNAPTDLKELIPEFYCVSPLCSDFLVNDSGLDLGQRQDGRHVGDVALPPWARSPRDFIEKMRQALECQYVSAHLHEWINLIFGYQQTGRAAVEANNLFYYLTYENSVNMEAIENEEEKKSIEMQINEFGQTPRQLFHTKHKKKGGAEEEEEAPIQPEQEKQEESKAGAGAVIMEPIAQPVAVPVAAAASTPSHATAPASLSVSSSFSSSYPVTIPVSAPVFIPVPLSVPTPAPAPVTAPAPAPATPHRPVVSVDPSTPLASASSLSQPTPPASAKSAAAGEKKSIASSFFSLFSPSAKAAPPTAATPATAPTAPAAAAPAASTGPAAVAAPTPAPAAAPEKRSALSDLASLLSVSSLKSKLSAPSSSSSTDSAPSHPQAPGLASPDFGRQPSSALSDFALSESLHGQAPAAAAVDMQLPVLEVQLDLQEELIKLSSAPGAEPAVIVDSSGSLGAVSSHSPLPPSSSASSARWSLDFPQLKRTALLSTHHDSVTGLLFTPDSSSLISISADSHIKCYSLSERKQYRSTKLSALALSDLCWLGAGSDGQGHVAVSSWDNHIYLYSIASGRVISSLSAHDDAVSCLFYHDFAASGALVSGSWDSSIKMWAVRESELERRPLMDWVDSDSPIKALHATPSGSLMVAGNEDGLLFSYDLRTRHPLNSLDLYTGEEVCAIHCLADGSVVAAASGTAVHLIDTRTGRLVVRHTMAPKERVAAIRSDGARLACGGERGAVRVWDLNGDQPPQEAATVKNTLGAITAMAFSPAGTGLAVGFNRQKDNLALFA